MFQMSHRARYRNEYQWKKESTGVNMTLATIFKSVWGPSASHKFFSERNSDYHHYHHGSHKHHKTKSKSEKKQAILSALTLLAFLFFLNILQSCIREQNANRGTVMMFPTGPTAPTGHQAKDPSGNEEKPERNKRDVGEFSVNRTESNRKSRTLLGIEEPLGDVRGRQVKFIRNFSSVNNWTKELTSISEKELNDQKLKTMNFPMYWKNRKFASTELRSTQNPLGRNQSYSLRNFKKRERTSGELLESKAEPSHKTWNYKKPENFKPSPLIPSTNNRHSSSSSTQKQSWQSKTTTSQTALNTPTTTNAGSFVATTPRNRRSDYSTAQPGEYDDYDRYSDQTREDASMSPTPAMGLDLNTFQTFPVYNYYNHRPSSYKENQSESANLESESPEIDRIHNEVRVTTQLPLFHPTKVPPSPSSSSYHKPPHLKHRYKHPHFHVRNPYPMESRYRYSPYRKTGSYEPSHFHDHRDDFFPPVVLAKYEVQDDEPGFDLTKFLWAMVNSFARPLTKLVPTFAKDNHEEAQCYDLLVCEAQRVSRFMGPTAEALATTVGTLLTWAATEETRQTVLDAINSGRENTCQQQIRDCEERSGGKSAMTVIAQVMEMKLR